MSMLIDAEHPQGGEGMSVDRTADNQQSLDPDIGSLSLCHDTTGAEGGVYYSCQRQTDKQSPGRRRVQGT